MTAQGAIQTANRGLPCFAGIIPANHRLESKYRFAVLPFLRTWYNDCARRNPDREPRSALQGAILTGITANIIGVKCKYERTDTAIQATAEVP